MDFEEFTDDEIIDLSYFFSGIDSAGYYPIGDSAVRAELPEGFEKLKDMVFQELADRDL